MSYGQYLKSLRKSNNLTQKQLSTVLSVSSRYISYIENEQREPSKKVLKKYSQVFNVPFTDIFLAIYATKCS